MRGLCTMLEQKKNFSWKTQLLKKSWHPSIWWIDQMHTWVSEYGNLGGTWIRIKNICVERSTGAKIKNILKTTLHSTWTNTKETFLFWNYEVRAQIKTKNTSDGPARNLPSRNDNSTMWECVYFIPFFSINLWTYPPYARTSQ